MTHPHLITGYPMLYDPHSYATDAQIEQDWRDALENEVIMIIADCWASVTRADAIKAMWYVSAETGKHCDVPEWYVEHWCVGEMR